MLSFSSDWVKTLLADSGNDFMMAEDHRIALYSSTEDIEEVVGKAEVLLSQTEQYRAFLIQNKKEKDVELSTFLNNIAKEHNVLQRVKSALSLDVSFLCQDLLPSSSFAPSSHRANLCPLILSNH